MSFAASDKRMLREATGVARALPNISGEDKITLLRLDAALGAGGAPETWPMWNDARILRVLLDRVDPAYAPAIKAFASNLKLDIPGEQSSPSPAPAPASSQSPDVALPKFLEILAAFAQMGIQFGSKLVGNASPLVIQSINGVGIYFQSDTDNTSEQRYTESGGSQYPQFFGIAISGDGGGGLFQNIIYPEDGTPEYIPDPTRPAVTWRLDRYAAMSVDVFKAGAEFAPGRFEIIGKPGQQFVFLSDFDTGDLTIRLPQWDAKLYVENGWANHPDHKNGSREFRRRQAVMLEGDYPQA